MKKLKGFMMVLGLVALCLSACGTSEAPQGVSEGTPQEENLNPQVTVDEGETGQLEENSDLDAEEIEESDESATEDPNVYALGQTILVNYFGEPSFELAVTDVSLADERNQYSDKTVENVALITVVGKNISDENQYLSDSYFQFYDETGAKLDSYPLSGEFPQIEEVSSGRHATIQFAIGIRTGSSLEIQVFHQGEKNPMGSVDSTTSVEPTLDLSSDSSGIAEIQLGEVVTVNYFGAEAFELAITDISLTNERNQFSDQNVENVALITVKGTNVSNQNQYLSYNYFQFYDETGAKLSFYPVSGEFPQIEDVSSGRNATIQFAIGIPVGSHLEIEFSHQGEDNPFGLLKFN